MEVTFSTRDDGQVDGRIGTDQPVLQEALDDSISSLPPRGAPGNGPSSYWIDHAQEGAHQAHERGDECPFTSGNITVLSVRGDMVVAKYDFDKPDVPGDEMPLNDFLALLEAWKAKVTESAAKATEPLPEKYRRKPFQ